MEVLKKRFNPGGLILALLLFAPALLSGCRGSGAISTIAAPVGEPTSAGSPAPEAILTSIATAAIPPTPTLFHMPTDVPTATEVFAQPEPSATPACSDNLRFVSDLTIPDGTPVETGATIDKRWQVENSGTCNWDAHYRVRLISGPDLGAPATQALYPARSGTQAVIRMVLTAPAEVGTFRSAWQAFNPKGEAFGDPFYIEILVTGL